MEKALHISRSLKLPPIAPASARRTTNIVGSQYCQNQLPSLMELASLRRGHAGAISLATSLLTDAGLARLKRFLARAVKNRLFSELIVNDWGLCEFIRSTSGYSVSAGQLFVEELSRMDPAWARRFCAAHRIASAEADNQDLAKRIVKNLALRISYHVPYRLKAVTTFCPFERHFRANCSFSCERGGPGRLFNKHVGYGLHLRQKAYFVKGTTTVPHRGFWRIVQEPPHRS
jgi:hypothetical protein